MSGINRGYNLGLSAYCPAPWGRRGKLRCTACRRIATSLPEDGAPRDYGFAAEEVLGVARRVKQYGLPPNTFLNVNIPAMPQGGYRGYRITTQAMQQQWRGALCRDDSSLVGPHDLLERLQRRRDRSGGHGHPSRERRLRVGHAHEAWANSMRRSSRRCARSSSNGQAGPHRRLNDASGAHCPCCRDDDDGAGRDRAGAVSRSSERRAHHHRRRGYGDIGSYGAPDIKTPNIDSLAKNGTRLTDFYAAPNCSPTRAALISGRYQQRYRIEVAARRGAKSRRRAGSAGDGTLAAATPEEQRLSHRAHWQVAPGLQEGVQPRRARVRLLLRLQERPHRLLPAHRLSRGNTICSRTMSRRTSLATRRTCSPNDRSVSSNRTPGSHSSSRWPTTPLTGRSRCPTIRRWRPNNARFVQPQDNPTSTRQDYISIVERADRGVGQILAALERRGLTRNTLVIYTQDNGGEWLSRNAPLFNRKNSVWEGGIRVPAIFRWPGRIPAGRTSSQVGIVMDLTATILAATNSAGAGRGAARGHQPAAAAAAGGSARPSARCSSGSRGPHAASAPFGRGTGS